MTVLGHAAGSAAVTAGSGFVAHTGAVGLTAMIALNNATGTRSDLEVDAASVASGALSGGPAPTYWLSAGSSQLYTATFNVGNTPGTLSDTVTFVAGDRQSLSGANLLGMLTATITGSAFSGSARWTSSGGSTWNDGGNWTDANAVSIHAAPGTFGSFADTDSAVFSGFGSATTISISGANPSLAALSFSGSNYTLSGGTLTLASGSGPPTISVSDHTQTIFSTITGTQGLWKTGGGTLVLSGSNCYTGGTFVETGELLITNPYAVPDGFSLSVGAASYFPSLTAVVSDAATLPAPEPSTLALLCVGVLGLTACIWRRHRLRFAGIIASVAPTANKLFQGRRVPHAQRPDEPAIRHRGRSGQRG